MMLVVQLLTLWLLMALAQTNGGLPYVWDLVLPRDMEESAETADVRRQTIDVAELQTVVQQQGEQLEQIQADVTALTNELVTCKNALNIQVAFTAYMSRFHEHPTNNVFIFDHVVTDIGGGYNSNTGVFTAPANGIYVFSFNLIDDNRSPTFHAGITKNNQTLVAATIEGHNNSFDAGTAIATTRLVEGDLVKVKRLSGGTNVYGDIYCHFSGYLLSPDL